MPPHPCPDMAETIRNAGPLERILGEICKAVLPVPEETFLGNEDSSTAVCTLSSIRLLREISQNNLDCVAIVGRLFSENAGIDMLVRFVNSHKNIRTVILCGEDARGHRPGESLLALYKNGIDADGRIVSSHSPHPFLQVGSGEVGRFQSQVSIIDRIGETDPSVIIALIDRQ